MILQKGIVGIVNFNGHCFANTHIRTVKSASPCEMSPFSFGFELGILLEMEVEANNPQQKISFDTIITVFLRTFLATFGGAVGAYLLVAAGHYLRIPKGIVHSKVK
jgi:hypothetical protein